MTSKLLSYFLKAVSLLVILVAVAALALSVLLKDLDSYSRQALDYYEGETGYKVTFQDISLHFKRGMGLRLNGFRLVHTDSGREMLRGDRLYVHIKLLNLLKKKITIRQLLIEEPQIRVYRNQDRSWQSFLSALMIRQADEDGSVFGDYHVKLLDLSLSGGTLEIRDFVYDSTVRLYDCDIRLHRAEQGLFQLQVDAQHRAGDSRGAVRLSSEFHRSLIKRSGPDADQPVLLTAALSFSHLPVQECLSYLPEKFAVPVGEGLLDGEIDFELRQNRQLRAEGALALSNAQVLLPGLDPAPLPETVLDVTVDVGQGSVACSSFALQIEPDVQLSGSATAAGLDTEAPQLSVRIQSGMVNTAAIAERIVAADSGQQAWPRFCRNLPVGAVTAHEVAISAAFGEAFKLSTISMQGTLGVEGIAGSDSLKGFAVDEGSLSLEVVLDCKEGLRMAAEIDATEAAYSMGGIIGKSRKVPNRIKLDYINGETDTVQMPFEFSLGESLAVSGRLLPGDDFVFDGRFSLKDFDLATAVFPFLPPGLSMQGTVAGNGVFAFPVKGQALRPVTGTLQLDDVALVQTSDARVLLQTDAELDFPSASAPIVVKAGRVTSGSTRGAFAGKLGSIVPLAGALKAPMENYDIGEFVKTMVTVVRHFKKMKKKSSPKAGKADSLFGRMNLAVDLTSRQTSYLDWEFGPGRCDFSLRNKRFLWDAIDIAGGGGTVNGSVLYDLSSPDKYRLVFSIDRSDVDVTWAIPAFREQQNITGRLNLESRFSSQFKRGREVLDNMEGSFDFVVNDGKVKGMALISNILNALNVAQLLTFRMPEFSAEGMPFDTMEGNFMLKNKVLTTDDLLLKCPSMDFSAVGSIDLARKELDLLIGVQIFRTVAKALGAVPYFGRKLTGEGKTLTFTYFKASGASDDPKIVPLPSRAVDNAIQKLFKSVREVPQDLMGLTRGMMLLFEMDSADNETAQ